MTQSYEVPLDSRSAGLASARPELLRAASQQWPDASGAPDQIRELLRVSRDMFVHAAFLYDLFMVASTWSLLAMEAALRDRLGADKGPGFKRLVAMAQEAGLLTPEEAGRLGSGARLRNELVHPQGHMAYTRGMTQGFLAVAHETISRLYSDASD